MGSFLDQIEPLKQAAVAEMKAAADLPALERLYGAPDGPDYFCPAMLEEGIFYGVREGGELAAAAGTHIVSRMEGVAAIGNVYTRSARRGKGLGMRVTSAVIGALSAVPTVVLNVREANAGAIRIYERLGFARHCAFLEGRLIRRD